MNDSIVEYNDHLSVDKREICELLAGLITDYLHATSNKVWQGHPTWFINSNPIVSYSSIRTGIKLLFWSGVDFDETRLQPGTDKSKYASIVYSQIEQIDENEIEGWLKKSETIQYSYKDIVKNKGNLKRLEFND